jgi:hypothetical protein
VSRDPATGCLDFVSPKKLLLNKFSACSFLQRLPSGKPHPRDSRIGFQWIQIFLPEECCTLSVPMRQALTVMWTLVEPALRESLHKNAEHQPCLSHAQDFHFSLALEAWEVQVVRTIAWMVKTLSSNCCFAARTKPYGEAERCDIITDMHSTYTDLSALVVNVRSVHKLLMQLPCPIDGSETSSCLVHSKVLNSAEILCFHEVPSVELF